jgi:hypothetical protein
MRILYTGGKKWSADIAVPFGHMADQIIRFDKQDYFVFTKDVGAGANVSYK